MSTDTEIMEEENTDLQQDTEILDHSFEDSTELEQELSDFSPALLNNLKKLRPNCYGMHRSWGVGKITNWDIDEREMTIDFTDKTGHTMDFEFAAKSLRPLPSNHIQVRIIENPEEVKFMFDKNLSELVEQTVRSLGKNCTVDQLQKVFVPFVVDEDDWKKRWNSMKRVMKKDSRYEIPTKKTLPIVIHDDLLDYFTVAKQEFDKAVGAKAQAAALKNLRKAWKKKPDENVAAEIIQKVNQTLSLLPESQLDNKVLLTVARDLFTQEAGIENVPNEVSLASILPKDTEEFMEIYQGLPSSIQTDILEMAKSIWKDDWKEFFIKLLPNANSRMIEMITQAFQESNCPEVLLSALEKLIRKREISPDMLVWICKNRKTSMQPLVNYYLFSTILSVLEYDQFGDYKRGTRLHDLMFKDKDLVADLLASSSDQNIQDITRIIRLSPAFDELDKRSILATMIKLYPFVQETISAAEKASEHSSSASSETSQSTTSTFVVSWESLEKRRQELEELINKKIPENSKEISVARSYGDLSENHEFKSAKEMQGVLLKRKSELEQMLANCQGTDFKGASTSEVNIGTRVTLKNTQTQEKQILTVLGAWDSNPDQGVISYQTAIAQKLLNRIPGDEVELPLENGETRNVVIESIEAYNS